MPFITTRGSVTDGETVSRRREHASSGSLNRVCDADIYENVNPDWISSSVPRSLRSFLASELCHAAK